MNNDISLSTRGEVLHWPVHELLWSTHDHWEGGQVRGPDSLPHNTDTDAEFAGLFKVTERHGPVRGQGKASFTESVIAAAGEGVGGRGEARVMNKEWYIEKYNLELKLLTVNGHT